MVTEIQVVFLIVAGIIGTLLSIGLGWTESTEPFDVKKFISSLIRGSIGIVIYILGAYALAPSVGVWDYVEIAIFAAGFDALIKRGQGAVQSRTNP